MKNKSELINFVARQVNVNLENDPNGMLNSGRRVLYTSINRTHRNAVLGLLNKNGIRYESHIQDKYFIYI